MTAMNRAQQAILDGIPKRVRQRYAKRCREAPTSYRAAVMLKCLDCCAWEYRAVKLCEVEACSLHVHREKLFNNVSRKEQIRAMNEPREKDREVPESA